MKKLILMIAAGMLAVSPAFGKSLTIDPAKSQVKWLGKKVTGQHNGSVPVKGGKIEVDAKNGIKGGKIEIDMSKIVVEDLKDAEYNKKLTDHLKSDDFFGVEKNPVSTFEITNVKSGLKSMDATHEITGKLTIKGHTETVTFPAKVEFKGKEATATGKFMIDRTKYNIRYGSGKFFENLGDKMINDEFEVELNLHGKT